MTKKVLRVLALSLLYVLAFFIVEVTGWFHPYAWTYAAVPAAVIGAVSPFVSAVPAPPIFLLIASDIEAPATLPAASPAGCAASVRSFVIVCCAPFITGVTVIVACAISGIALSSCSRSRRGAPSEGAPPCRCAAPQRQAYAMASGIFSASSPACALRGRRCSS